MKKLLIISVFWFGITFLSFSQGIIEALRYSQFFHGGTTRSLSMANSFGALGGDMSTLGTNPAGLGVYRGSEFTFTPLIHFNTSEADFLNSGRNDNKYRFSIGNIGYVGNINTGSSIVKNINIGIAYNQLRNYNQRMLIYGRNPQSSLIDYFGGFHVDNIFGGLYSDLDGVDPNDLYPFTEGLAYDAQLIMTEEPDFLYDSYIYNSLSPLSRVTVDQIRTVEKNGSHGEWSFSMGGNISDFIYFGATLGYQTIRYEENTSHREVAINPAVDNNFRNFTYFEELQTTGGGYNFKLGMIVRPKPIPNIRFGLAFHLPTVFRLEDEYYSTMTSNFVSGVVRPYDPATDSDLGPGISEYKLRTPSKFIGSVAYQFKNVASLNVDYEYIDYTQSQLSSRDGTYDYFDQNNEIKDAYNATHNVKVGLEYKIGQIYLRGGYAYYQSPFRKGELNEDSDNSILAGGFGYREKNFFFDLGVMGNLHNEKFFMYPHENLEVTSLSSNNYKLSATFGFRF